MTLMGSMPLGSAQAASASTRTAYVGCRTTKERNARGKGIGVYRVTPSGWTQIQLVEGLDNPSFLALDRTGRFLYALHGDLSDISAYAIHGGDGTLTLLNRQSTGGKNPVHLVPDPSNRFMVVANYATGSLATLPILSDGQLGPVVDLAQLPGTPGPHKSQQQSAHPHDVPYDRQGRFMVVPDKGLDKVFTYRVDPANGRLIAGPAVKSREGAGPRHADFHPSLPLTYVVNELDSTVTTYRYDPQTGSLQPLQIVSTLPDSYTGDNTGAEIAVAPSGRHLFVSNRGHDTIATIAIDVSTGLLSPKSWVESRGKGPRFFALDPDGTQLYAANENSDTVIGFKIDPSDGRLTPSGLEVRTGSPVCVVFGSDA